MFLPKKKSPAWKPGGVLFDNDLGSGLPLSTSFAGSGGMSYPMPTSDQEWTDLLNDKANGSTAFKDFGIARIKVGKEGALARLALLQTSLKEPMWSGPGKKLMLAVFLTDAEYMRKRLLMNLLLLQSYISDNVHPTNFKWAQFNPYAFASYNYDYKKFKLNRLYMATPNADGTIYDKTLPYQYWQPGLWLSAQVPKFDLKSPGQNVWYTPADAVEVDSWNLKQTDYPNSFFFDPLARSLLYNSLASTIIHETAHAALFGKDLQFKNPIPEVIEAVNIGANWPIGALHKSAKFTQYTDESLERVASLGGAASDEKAWTTQVPVVLKSQFGTKGASTAMQTLAAQDLPVSTPYLLEIYAQLAWGLAKKAFGP